MIPLMYNISLPDGFSREFLDATLWGREDVNRPRVHWCHIPSGIGVYQLHKLFEDCMRSLENPPKLVPFRMVIQHVIFEDRSDTAYGYVLP